MSSKIDRSLDEILADKKKPSIRGPRNNNNSGNSGNSNNIGVRLGVNGRRQDRRNDHPRDGVRKSYRSQSQKTEDEWVHDRYDDDNFDQHAERPLNGRDSAEHTSGSGGARIKVTNLHYDLSKEDLESLFERQGRVLSVELLYDRAGRSEGIAFVTYESYDDAKSAVRDFDGANAKGQPIRLTIVSSNAKSRNAFNGAVKPGSGRPLAERITRPGKAGSDGGDSHGSSRNQRQNLSAASRQGIDRYIPQRSGQSRSRSPLPRGRREGGRRPGERREPDRTGSRTGQTTRPKKTQEELDAEMEDYFGSGQNEAEEVPGFGPGPTGQEEEDDTDMIG